jgi:hypothetical protein
MNLGTTQMKINIIIILIYFGLTNCQTQTKTDTEKQKTDNETALSENSVIQVEIHSRVDTTKNDIKEIATLWTNYLNSEPDRISDNPYWNEEEKLKYKDFDFSRRLL